MIFIAIIFLWARPRAEGNPVSKKWQLVNDFTDYSHSSAAFYEKGVKNYDKMLHVNEILL